MGKAFGQRLRQLRRKRGKSLKGADPEIGLSYSYLSKLENGVLEPSEDTIDLLADYFGVNRETLGILAGRLPPDVLEILQHEPEKAVQFLRDKFGEG